MRKHRSCLRRETRVLVHSAQDASTDATYVCLYMCVPTTPGRLPTSRVNPQTSSLVKRGAHIGKSLGLTLVSFVAICPGILASMYQGWLPWSETRSSVDLWSLIRDSSSVDRLMASRHERDERLHLRSISPVLVTKLGQQELLLASNLECIRQGDADQREESAYIPQDERSPEHRHE